MTSKPSHSPEPANPADGPGLWAPPDLGRRGGGWVALQGALLVGAAATGWFGVRWPQSARLWLGMGAALVFVLGIALLLGGGVGLGRQLTPFPRPVAAGELRRDGIYSLVRHPIYGGVLLLLLGWALASSPWAMIPVAVSAAFFDAKRRREERWLQDQYPAYAEYRDSVRRRFIPFVW